jgi:hypothetical protein
MTNQLDRKRVIKITIVMLILGVVSFSLGIAFILIFIGTYGLVIFIMPYSKLIRHFVELLLSADLSAISHPIYPTPWSTSLLFIVFRVILIILGILLLHNLGFKGQNIIWLILHH